MQKSLIEKIDDKIRYLKMFKKWATVDCPEMVKLLEEVKQKIELQEKAIENFEKRYNDI